jgi:ArsR family transcriptional regulator
MNRKIDCDLQCEILKALGHPIRLKIVVGLLNSKEHCNVNEMALKLNIPQSTTSQHLGILRNRGIIAPKKTGVETCYEVINPKVREIIEILKDE